MKIVFALLLVLVIPISAQATWSIIAIDPVSKEVGVAGASCHHDVHVIGRVVPGRGALVAQALTNIEGREVAAAHLAAGKNPLDIVEELGSFPFDVLHPLRQYAVVTFGHAPVSYTGMLTIPWAGVMTAENVSVQGNILRGPKVASVTLATFIESPQERPFADRLIMALQAGARVGGDLRCSFEQTALSAFVMVAAPNDNSENPTVRIIVPTQERGGKNPVLLLRENYERTRTR